MAKRKGKVATAADIAAVNFKPLSAKALKDLEPPSNDEWLELVIVLRLAWSVLGQTKDKLKGVVRKGETDEFSLIGSFESSADRLKAYAETLGMAKMRLMSAGAAFCAEVKAAQEASS
jgi:hypothetical protein